MLGINQTITVSNTGHMMRRTEATGYKMLAVAVIETAIQDRDMHFFKKEWCKELCELADINYDALCEKVGVK